MSCGFKVVIVKRAPELGDSVGGSGASVGLGIWRQTQSHRGVHVVLEDMLTTKTSDSN